MWWILVVRAWGRDWSATDATALTEVLADPDLAVGDVIELGATTFTGPFLVPPGVELRGISPEETVFDAASGNVIEAQGPAPTAAATTLSRLTVAGGGVARALLARHDVVLDDVRLVGGAADTGGLVRVEGTVTLDVRDSTLSGGSASSEGGQVWLDVGSTATISGSTLIGGRANGAGGAISANGATLVVTDSLLTGHKSSGHGGALALVAGQSSLVDSVVSRSEAGVDNRGGGLWVSGGALEATRTRLEDDLARDGGGAWLGDDATITLTEVEVRGAGADRDGGGLFVGSLQALTATGLALISNRAGGGAGLYVDGCCTTPFVIRDARLCSNAVEDRGIFDYGGGTDPRGGHARLLNATGVFDNVLWLDGAATSSDDSQIGALSIEGGSVDLVHQVFAWNRSPGYAAVRTRDSAVVDVRNTLFAWNVGAQVLTDDAGAMTLAYAAFAGNDGLPTQPDTLLDATSLAAVDPGFEAGPGSCELSAWLAPDTSPLHDAGDPARQDADGSRSDIGLSGAGAGTGGPQLDPDEPFRRDCSCATTAAPALGSPAAVLLVLSAWRRRAPGRRSSAKRSRPRR
ncbi:MAG: hypothetical protein H6738_01695 [Alphaproteobacteria bacterium]|nr:hypothetical protein [Alphaproteobacteria bacterium]MCB9695481.1 hypothetical protein [Alphaproteobacteria bacterium]